jgi:hypothetical protein
MARNLNPEEATPMLGLIHYSSRSAPLYGLVLLFLTLLLTHILPAQSRMTRKATHHTEPASRSVVAQTVPEPPLLASFSHRESAPLSELRPSASLSAALAPTASFHQSVNLGLLLPPTTGRFASPTTANETTSASNSVRDLILPSAFAEPSGRSPSSRSNDDAAQRFADRLNDPEFYAHHIPGAGPIVDRVLKESKLHPHLTRVLEFIQPQF